MKKLFKKSSKQTATYLVDPIFTPRTDRDFGDTTALAPVYTIANRLRAIFSDDPKISIPVPEKNSAEIVIHVADSLKAAALSQIIPAEYEDEGVSVRIINDNKDRDVSDVFAAAFDGNPHFAGIIVSRPDDDAPVLGGEVFSTVFKKEVIQFPNGNAGAIGGRETTTMEELVRRMMPNTGKMTFCTELD